MSIYDDIRAFQTNIEKAMPSINEAMRQKATLSDAFARVALDYSALNSTIAEAAKFVQPQLQPEGASAIRTIEELRPQLSAEVLRLSDTMAEIQPALTVVDSMAKIQPQLDAHAFNILRTADELQPLYSSQAVDVIEAGLEQMRPNYSALVSGLNEAIDHMRPDINLLSSSVFEMVDEMRPSFDVFATSVMTEIDVPRIDFGLLVSSVPEVNLFDTSSILNFPHSPYVVDAPTEAPTPTIETWPPEGATVAQLVVVITHRYREYKDGREPLGTMTYAVVNLLQESARGSRNAAREFGISENVLDKMRQLSSTRGSYLTARKFDSSLVPRDFSDGEVSWMESAVEAVVSQLESLASSRGEPRFVLTLGDPRLVGLGD